MLSSEICLSSRCGRDITCSPGTKWYLPPSLKKWYALYQEFEIAARVAMYLVLAPTIMCLCSET